MIWSNFVVVVFLGFAALIAVIAVVRWAFGIEPDSRPANIISVSLLALLAISYLLMIPVGT